MKVKWELITTQKQDEETTKRSKRYGGFAPITTHQLWLKVEGTPERIEELKKILESHYRLI